MPDVTVLMAVHNGMPYLPEAVDSIRRQTLDDWRFVIIDDGSTDATADYLDRLDDPRIEVVHVSNEGLGTALNRGLALCRTEFVARMDSDDIAHPTRLEEQAAFLRTRPEVGLVGTQIERFGEVRTGSRSLLPSDHGAIIAHLMEGLPALYHPTVMCRTALLREIGGYWSHRMGEDWDMLLRMGEAARLANLDRVLLSYQFRAESLTGAYMTETRSAVAYAIDCARRRQSGAAPINYEAFMARRRAAPWWRRAAEALEIHARCQYRFAVGEILGSRRLRGCLRLVWAAMCSPRLTQQRIARILQHWRPLRRRHTENHANQTG